MVSNMNKFIEQANISRNLRMDCYRLSLYPILKYYNCDADLLIISNNLMLKKGKPLFAETTQFIDYNKLISNMGIGQMVGVLKSKEMIINTLRKCIDQGGVAICFIDCYYYSPFRAVYNKSHVAHSIPVCGYDDENQVFYAIDYNYFENFSRTVVSVPYDDLSDSMLGYIELKNLPNIQIMKIKYQNLDYQDIRYKYIN